MNRSISFLALLAAIVAGIAIGRLTPVLVQAQERPAKERPAEEGEDIAKSVAPDGRNGAGPVRLPQPFDVLAHMEGVDQKAFDIRVSGALTWDLDKAGPETFLRLSNRSGKLWYIPVDRVVWIEAIPIPADGLPAAPPPPVEGREPR